ncbi:MAG TPA: hypothetical protein VEQ59_21845, partial [Polyangiaceae bacterium]|nr:hypothetical protein [Polyangiaceae bacterium]
RHADPPRHQIDGSGFDTRTIVLLGEATLFAAGLTTGLVFTVVRGGASDRYQSANEAVLADPAVGGADPDGVACAGDNRPDACADLIEAGQDRTRATNYATAGFVTAGVSAAAFGLTYWLWPSAPASAHAAVVPGGLSVSVSGRF